MLGLGLQQQPGPTLGLRLQRQPAAASNSPQQQQALASASASSLTYRCDCNCKKQLPRENLRTWSVRIYPQSQVTKVTMHRVCSQLTKVNMHRMRSSTCKRDQSMGRKPSSSSNTSGDKAIEVLHDVLPPERTRQPEASRKCPLHSMHVLAQVPTSFAHSRVV